MFIVLVRCFWVHREKKVSSGIAICCRRRPLGSQSVISSVLDTKNHHCSWERERDRSSIDRKKHIVLTARLYIELGGLCFALRYCEPRYYEVAEGS